MMVVVRVLLAVTLIAAGCSSAAPATLTPTAAPTADPTAELTPAQATPSPTQPAVPTETPVPTPTPTEVPTEVPTTPATPSPLPEPPIFTAPTRISATSFAYLRVATDAAGAVHVIATTEEVGRGLFHLTNASGVWTEEEITTPPADGSDNAIVLASDTDRSIWMAFKRFDVWNPCFFVCEPPDSHLDGLFVINNVSGTWSEPERLPEGIGSGFDMSVRNGELQIAYELRQGDDPPQIAYAANLGGTWMQEVVFPGFWPDIELGLSGDPRIVYVSQTPSDTYEIHLALRAEGLWNFAPAPDSNGDPTPPQLAVNSADATVVSYAQFDPARGYISWTSTLDGTGWSPRQEMAPEGADEIALGPGDALHIIYPISETESNDGLWWGWLGGGSAVNRLLDASVRNVADGLSAPQSLALDASGLPHIVYGTPYDEGREGLWYVSGVAP